MEKAKSGFSRKIIMFWGLKIVNLKCFLSAHNYFGIFTGKNREIEQLCN